MNAIIEKLVGNDEMRGAGSWVFSDQGVAEDKGFRNVSKYWYEKTLSVEDGLAQLEKGRSETVDFYATAKQMVPTVSAGNFSLQCPEGRLYRPTTHAMTQLGEWAGTGSKFVLGLLEGDEGDAETLVRVVQNAFRRLDPEKKFLWRARQDGTLRAMLSTEYARVDNRWFLEALHTILPGCRLSHWRGDSDTIYGNVLIPDTVRAETDSEYGGMLSVGNSEIGERRITSLPSIFRAVCMNGCIWGQAVGKGIHIVHRGNIDLGQLFDTLEQNITEQIPLLPVGIERLLSLRQLGWTGDSIKPLFAHVARENKLTKKQASSLLQGYHAELAVAPDSARTLFGVVAAITRASQKMSNEDWVRLDTVAGKLSELDSLGWAGFTKQALGLTVTQVEAAFATAL